MSGCCPSKKKKTDYVFLASLGIGSVFYFAHLLLLAAELSAGPFNHLVHIFYELMNTMALGIVLGIFFVGALGLVPRENVISLLGDPKKKSSIFRATIAGVLLDLCSHGILMVGMKLYERGASTGQVMAFLIASPWNSLSLTIILVALVGLPWTLTFIALSMVIAVISGFVFHNLEQNGTIPANPNKVDIPENKAIWQGAMGKTWLVLSNPKNWLQMMISGIKDSKMIIKWILFGAILSSLIQAFVNTDVFQQYFGPTVLGLIATLVATTIIEVCSEGSTPIAADLLNRAGAPGNAFTFLMAGVATDYTEILSVKDTMKSWKTAFFIPLVTVPQVLVIGYLLNN